MTTRSGAFAIECHCGSQQLTAETSPSDLTLCNCSYCHRIGALWAYYDARAVTLRSGSHTSQTYRWGEKSIAYHRCRRCGCTTHYRSVDADGAVLIALNCKMAAEDAIAGIPIRDFDGRSSWRYLDE